MYFQRTHLSGLLGPLAVREYREKSMLCATAEHVQYLQPSTLLKVDLYEPALLLQVECGSHGRPYAISLYQCTPGALPKHITV